VVVAPGIVEPAGGEIAVAAQEAGWIARIEVAEGARVEAGQVLATLDDSTQRSALALAAADLAGAEAEVTRIEAGPTAEELAQARAELAGATARSQLTRSTAVRARTLHGLQAIPDAEEERALVEERAQQAQVDRSAARLRELERGARIEDRAAARARVAAARARLGMANAALARRVVVAPGAGEILLSRFHPGEHYDPGAGPLFLLGDTARLRVRLEVDEIDALDVRAGARCALVSDAGAPLGEGVVDRAAPRMGRRRLSLESPTARADVRVREVFVDVAAATALVPGQRVWGRAVRSGDLARARADAR
jgi:multidrug resistance efflux pump